MEYGDFICNSFCPYFLTIQGVQSSPIVEDGCVFYNYYYDGAGGEYCCFDVGFYCSNGYILHSEYLAKERKEYISDGSGFYFTSTYCASGQIYSCSNYNLFISQLSNCYPNGFNIVKHDGDGGFYPDPEFCVSGHLFDSQNCADYSYGYFSNGTGSYYAGILNYCSSGTCFCSCNYLIPLPPNNNLYSFGTFEILANGSGSRFCSNFNYENYGTTIYTNYLSDYSVSYNSDGTGFYYTGIDYCAFGYVFCSDVNYLNILNTGCYSNGFYDILADGTGGRNCCLLNTCFSGYLFEHIDLDLFRSLELYSDGTGSFFQCTLMQSGVISYIENCCILLPNSGCYLAYSNRVLENISGCKSYEDINYVQSGTNYYCDLFLEYSIDYFANGSGCYYCSINFCESGTLINSGIYSIQLPNLNYYNNGLTGLYANGTGSLYCSGISYCASGFEFYINNYDNCYEYYLSDGTGSFISGSDYCEFNYLFNTGSYLIQLPNLNYYANGLTGLYADGSGNRFLSGYSYCYLGYEFYSLSGIGYRSDFTGYYYSEFLEKRPTSTLNINWDFDAQTKTKYFSNIITGCGADICLSLYDNSCCFYEIDVICNTQLYLSEPYFNCAIFEDSVKPFLYIRNIGTGCLFLNSSTCENSGNYWSFNENRLSGISQSSGNNYLINSCEGVFLSIKSSMDGTSYLSISCYPFSFFYEATNINSVNSGLNFPVINSGIYECICNYPSYTDNDYSYNQVKSFGLNALVDENSCFKIKFDKTGTGLSQIDYFNKNIEINSCFGNTCFKSNIIVNCYYLVTTECFLSSYEFSGTCFEFQVIGNCNVQIYYNVDSTSEKLSNYLYCYSGSGSGDSNQQIFKIVDSSPIKINENDYFNSQCLYSYNTSSECLCVSIQPFNEFSIRDAFVKGLNLSGVYLPNTLDWNYSYSFYLFNSNESFKTGISGFWVNENHQFNQQCLINYVNLIHCSDSCYQTYCPSLYDIDVNFCENRYSTLDIQQKNQNSKSEAFILTPFVECSYFYKGLEFKYISYCSVFYGNDFYEIQDCCVPIVFSGCCCCICLNYPVRALSDDKLKIIAEYETLDRVDAIASCFDYSFLDFSFTCSQSNLSRFTFPKIYNSSISEYESPNVFIDICSNLRIQKNVDFYINPMDGSISDFYYGLNNLLLFVNSEVNGGCAYNFSASCLICCCVDFYSNFNQISGESGYYFSGEFLQAYFECCSSMINYISGTYLNLGYDINIQFKDSNPSCCVCTGYAQKITSGINECYVYESSDYNSLFLDLEYEFCKSNNLICTSGFLFLQNASFMPYCSNSLIPYKNISGNGYNYIFPVLSNISYTDCFNSCSSGNQCIQLSANENLNFSNTGFIYWGGSSGYIYLTGSTGQITGCQGVLNCTSSFNLLNNFYNVCFDSYDIKNTISGRCLNICKNFSYTGLQPISFCSNYALLDIRSPILNCCLLSYNCAIEDSGFNKIFYYSYDITKESEVPIRILAPESTIIDSVCWKDFELEKSILISNQDKSLGSIQKNISQINFCISGLFSNNNYNFNSCDSCYICIYIIGDL